MKKIITMAFVFALIFTMSACGGKDTGEGLGEIQVHAPPTDTKPADPPVDDDPGPQGDTTPAEPDVPMAFENVIEMHYEQERLFRIHFDTLKQDPWLPEDVGPSGAASLFSFYMQNNPDNEDGKFGDPNSMEGFIEKQGNIYTVAKDYVIENAVGELLIGDHVFVEGKANIADGKIWDSIVNKRDGKLVRHTRHDHQFFVGKMVYLNQAFSNDGYIDSDTITHSIIFIVSTEQSYQYVSGFLEYKVSEKAGFMDFDPTMTTADVKDILVANGYEIFLYGKAEDGKLVDLM